MTVPADKFWTVLLNLAGYGLLPVKLVVTNPQIGLDSDQIGGILGFGAGSYTNVVATFTPTFYNPSGSAITTPGGGAPALNASASLSYIILESDA